MAKDKPDAITMVSVLPLLLGVVILSMSGSHQWVGPFGPMVFIVVWIGALGVYVALARWAERGGSVLGRVAVVALVSSGMVAFGLWRGVSPWHMVLGCAMITIVTAGMTCGVLAWRGRKVSVSECAACRYETGPLDEMPERCPECGAYWKGEGGIATERYVRRPWLAAASWAVVLSIVLWLLPGPREALSGAAPTWMLIRSITTSQFFFDHHWERLEQRQLTPEQQVDAARALLDRRRADGGLVAPAAEGWLEMTVTMLPGELRERYFAEAADIALRHVGGARRNAAASTSGGMAGGTGAGRGEHIEIATDNRLYSMQRGVYFAIGEVSINGERYREPMSAVLHAVAGQDEALRPRIELPPERPLDVRVRVWMMVSPWGYFHALMRQEVEWCPAGQPLLPEPGPEWVQEKTLELRIER